MCNLFSQYTQQQLALINTNKTNSVLSSILLFDDYKICNHSITLETKINININKYTKYAETSDEVEEYITALINKLKTSYIKIIESLYEFTFNIEEVANNLNLTCSDIKIALQEVSLMLNSLIPNKIFDEIWRKIDDKELLFIEDIPLNSDFLKRILFALLSVKSCKEHYTFNKSFNAFTLYKYKNIIYISTLLKNYLLENEKNYLSIKELINLLPFNEKEISIYTIDILIENKILLKQNSKYIYLELQYMYEEKIQSALSKLKDDQVLVLKYRYVDELTLADTGDKLDKSRERIRQIEEMSIKKLYTLLPKKLLEEIRTDILYYKILPLYLLPIKDSMYRSIIIAIFCHKKLRLNLQFSIGFNSLIIDNKYNYKNILHAIINKTIENNQTLLTYEELVRYIKEILPNIKSKFIINCLVENNDLSTVNDKYFFHTQYKTKRNMVELIFQLEENGFETMKESSKIKSILDSFFPGSFNESDTGRNIATYAQTNDNILLWDWGKYIHIKHVQYVLNEFDFTNIVEYLNSNLKGTTQIDLNGYFEDHKNSLVNFGIISKYALHTLLKIKFPDEFSYQDSPWVSIEGTVRKELGDTLLSSMMENKIYTLDELSNKLKTQPSRIQQLIERQKNIIIVDVFKYVKLEDLNFPQKLLLEITEYINSIIKNLTFIYIDFVVNKFRLALNIINKYNKESVLLDLLKKSTLDKKFNINNTRIIDSNYAITRNSLNFHYIIENNLLNTMQSLDKNSLFNYFTSRGLSSRNIMLYYLYSKYKTVVRKDDNLFILISSIGLNNEKIEKLNILILENLKDEQNVDDLLIELENQLPTISLPWNKYILGDLLDNDLFEFYPNRVEPVYIKLKN